MNHINLRRTLHSSASSRADSCVSTHVTRRKSPTTLSDARKTRRVWLMVIASTVGIAVFSGVVHAALGGGVCEGTGAPGCAYVDESGALMRGYGTVVDAAGGTNYDVKISYVGLQNWSGSTWWTPIATTGGVWQFESDAKYTSWSTCSAGEYYRTKVTRNWRDSTGEGSSTFYSFSVVC